MQGNRINVLLDSTLKIVSCTSLPFFCCSCQILYVVNCLALFKFSGPCGRIFLHVLKLNVVVYYFARESGGEVL